MSVVIVQPVERCVEARHRLLEFATAPADVNHQPHDLALAVPERVGGAVDLADLDQPLHSVPPLSDARVRELLAIGNAALHQAIYGGPGPLGKKQVSHVR